METSDILYYTDRRKAPMNPSPKKRHFCHLTLFEILAVLTAAGIPIALGIYTAISSEQQRDQAERTREFDLKQAAEVRQHQLYDKFLTDMYTLEKDGYLDDDDYPWIYANAYHRAAHRQWDAIRKGDVLQFLKERKLIGNTRSIGMDSFAKQSKDIIQLNRLNFDQICLKSQTNSLNSLDMTSILFDEVSMMNSRFLFVNLDQTSFNHARVNQTIFDSSTLISAVFDGTELYQTDFRRSDLSGTRFINVDLTTAKLTAEQLRQAIFINTRLPNGTFIRSTTTTTTTTTVRFTTEESKKTGLLAKSDEIFFFLLVLDTTMYRSKLILA